jgi:hypothetical protein
MRKIKILLFSLILFQLNQLYAISENSNSGVKLKQHSKTVIATIDGNPIYLSDYEEFVNLFKKRPKTIEDKLNMLNNLINRRILIEDAREKGYFNRKDTKKNFKKHKFLDKSNKDKTYEETIVLREYFIENVSKKVKVSKKEIEDFIAKHKGYKSISKVDAKDMIAFGKEKKIFAELLQKLRANKKIVIFKQNLK